MERERRGSKEFLFPDDNLFRRKRASIDLGPIESDDDEIAPFEVEIENFNLIRKMFHFNHDFFLFFFCSL